jgi:hypothetical protein
MAVLEGSEPGAEPQSIPAQRMIAPGSSGTRINLDETEMRVRYEIHGIGADLAEGIQVSASGNVVQVDARQVSPQTKERLTAALANVPGVELEFGAGESDPGRTPTRTIPEKAVSPPPADGRLGLFFGGTEAQENFTRLALERGNRLLERLYALQELSARWPARRETRLSETARRRLDSMVRDHSRAARTEASELGKQLDPLLKNFGLSTSEQTGAPASISWQDAATSGLDAARRTDRALRSILTSSDAPLSIETGMPQIQHGLADLSRFVRSLPE